MTAFEELEEILFCGGKAQTETIPEQEFLKIAKEAEDNGEADPD